MKENTTHYHKTLYAENTEISFKKGIKFLLDADFHIVSTDMNTKVWHSTENGGFWKLDRCLIYLKFGKIAEFLSKRWIPFAQNTWVCSHSGNTGIFGEWAEAKRFWISIQPTDPLGSISVFDWKLNHGPWTLWMAVEEQMSATQSAGNFAKMKNEKNLEMQTALNTRPGAVSLTPKGESNCFTAVQLHPYGTWCGAKWPAKLQSAADPVWKDRPAERDRGNERGRGQMEIEQEVHTLRLFPRGLCLLRCRAGEHRDDNV